MSLKDQDIDQLFKGAKAPEPPPFQEEFWTEMEAMLPEKKRRKGGFWWFSGGTAALAVIGTSLWWINMQQPEAPVKTVALQQKTEQTETKTPEEAVEAPKEQQTFTLDMDWMKNFQFSSMPAYWGCGGSIDYMPNGFSWDPLASQPPVDANSDVDELPANEIDIDQTIAKRFPKPEPPKPTRFYAQLSAGIGQSAQRDVKGSSDLLHYYAAGVGLYKRIDNMVLTFGLNGRVDFVRNVLNSQQLSGTHRIDTRYEQLYSIELPASIGLNFGRNTIAATITPGFQTGFTGHETEVQNQAVVREERTSGQVENAKTLTMEIGASYWRTLQPDWQLGVSVNVDALRPFNPTTFVGEARLLPVNGQVILRRTF